MEIQRVAVVGAGMMGRMIAFVLADLYPVGLCDVREVDVESEILASTKELVEKGAMTEGEIRRRLANITFTTDRTSRHVADADMVVEAVFEDMALKQETFARLEEVCRPDCVFCTNTSVMSPSEISAKLKRRERFLGTHFWNPAHLIPLVEVVRTDATEQQAVDAVMDVLRRAGKRPILCKKDVPGFIANRLQHALWREAFYLVEAGIADPETVDEAVRYGPGLRWPVMGPMENSDLVGLDLTYNIHEYLLRHLADNHEPTPLLQEKMSRGEYGMKSGKGWMTWSEEDVKASNARLRQHLIDYLMK